MTAEIRATHWAAFRSGKWARLVGEVDHERGHRCYVVRFDDGTSDFWPVVDPQAGYEFRPAVSS